jgi:biopolymer transport protein ExbB/TolQ
MKDDRLRIVAFAEDAEVVLPITGDYKMAKSVVKRLEPALIAAQGTNIGKALETALLSFTESTKESRSRVMILITDGEEHNQSTEEAIERAVSQGVMVCAIGIGTPEGTALKIDGKLIEEEESSLLKLTNKTDILVRLGPIFGLLGTLIPLGPGLSALGTGDITTLAQSLTIAFDTTVTGLTIGAIGYVISKYRKQWYESDLATTETVAEAILEKLNSF